MIFLSNIMPASNLRKLCRLWPVLFTASCAHDPVIRDQTARVEKAYISVSSQEQKFNPALHKSTWKEEQKDPHYLLYIPWTLTEMGNVRSGLQILVNNGQQERATRILAKLAREHGINEAYLEEAPRYNLPIPSDLRGTNPYLSWKYGTAAQE